MGNNRSLSEEDLTRSEIKDDFAWDCPCAGRKSAPARRRVAC